MKALQHAKPPTKVLVSILIFQQKKYVKLVKLLKKAITRHLLTRQDSPNLPQITK